MRGASRWLFAAASLCLLSGFSAPAAHAQTGGTSVPTARVTAVRCLPVPERPCPGAAKLVAGGTAQVWGEGLQTSVALVFRGDAGAQDDVRVRPRHVRARHFEARVPAGARSGRAEVVIASGETAAAPGRVQVVVEKLTVTNPGDSAAAKFFAGAAKQPSVTVTADEPALVGVEVIDEASGEVLRTWRVAASAEPVTVRWDGRVAGRAAPSGRYRFRMVGAPPPSDERPGSFILYDHIFPIRGRHDLGQTETNNFGGGRGHQGQDLFAACGTSLVAARGGRVRSAGYHAAAGHYVVVTSAETRLDYVYMHMREAPLVRTGEGVRTGQALGAVGDSGNASGCHLHFELWSAPGWYSGGAALDPLPLLRAWNGWS